MIQHMPYSTGGFVLHKIMIGDRKFSAWFNKDGTLNDCEETTNYKSKAVRSSSIREELQQVGRRYAK